MKDYRSFETATWREDEWFVELDAIGRYFFLYLINNPSSNPAGIYRLPAYTMAVEAKLSEDKIKELLALFETDDKVYYEKGVVWVKKMREHQCPGQISANLSIHLQRCLDKIPDCRIKELYLNTYNTPSDPMAIPSRSHGNPIPIPSGTKHDPIRYTDTNTNKNTNKVDFKENMISKDKESAGNSAPSKKNERDPRIDHPAIKAVRELSQRYPPKEIWDFIIEAVGETPDIERLSLCKKHFAVKTSNPTNFDWAVSWYPSKNREPWENGNGYKPQQEKFDILDPASYRTQRGYEE